MKNEIELLLLLKESLIENVCSGMCSAQTHLNMQRKINYSESDEMKKINKRNGAGRVYRRVLLDAL